MKIRIVNLLLPVLVISCSENNILPVPDYNGEIEELEAELVCTIRDGKFKVGNVTSLAVVDDSTFAIVADYDKVLLYDKAGEQKRIVGRKGRADNEYLFPGPVRAEGGKIYVWSAQTLRFNIYGPDCKYERSASYDSAVMDFAPVAGKLYVYPAGVNATRVIDVVDSKSGSVSVSYGATTKEHRLLQHNISCAPFYAEDGNVYYSTVDKLSVSKDNASAPIAELDSPYFKVKELASDNLMKSDRKAAFEYMDSTPMLVKLMKSGDIFYLLAKEINGSENVYSIYRTDGKQASVTGRYSYESLSRPYLFCQYGEWLYFIAHSIVGDSDVYQLRRISLR